MNKVISRQGEDLPRGHFDLQTVLNLQVLLFIYPELECLEPGQYRWVYKSHLRKSLLISDKAAGKAVDFLMDIDVLEEHPEIQFKCRVYQPVVFVGYSGPSQPTEVQLFGAISLRHGEMYSFQELVEAYKKRVLLSQDHAPVEEPTQKTVCAAQAVEEQECPRTLEEVVNGLRSQAWLKESQAEATKQEADELFAEAAHLAQQADAIEATFRRPIQLISRLQLYRVKPGR